MKHFSLPLLLVTAILGAQSASAQAGRKPAATTHAKPAAPAKAPAKPVAKATPAAAPRPEPAPAPTPAPAATKASAATDAPFAVGTNAVNLGIGLGSRYGYGAGLFGGSSSVSPAISLSYERGILALGPGYLGVGAIVGYQGASYDFGGGDKWHYSDVVFMARGAFHYPVAAQFDAYAGLGLGLRYLHSSYDGTLNGYDIGSASASEITSGLFVGGRYFFTSSIGAFAELGYDQSYLKVGLSAKF